MHRLIINLLPVYDQVLLLLQTHQIEILCVDVSYWLTRKRKSANPVRASWHQLSEPSALPAASGNTSRDNDPLERDRKVRKFLINLVNSVELNTICVLWPQHLTRASRSVREQICNNKNNFQPENSSKEILKRPASGCMFEKQLWFSFASYFISAVIDEVKFI